MKILVLSDSHRILGNTAAVFEKLHDAVDMVMHLGDCVSDTSRFQEKLSSVKFYNVSGNCDFNFDVEDEMIVSVNTQKIFLTHGHRYNVKFNYQRLVYAAKEKEADVCLFGHTHQPVIFEHEGTLFMNPGSITFPRDRYGVSYGIIDIGENGKVNLSIVELGQRVIFQL